MTETKQDFDLSPGHQALAERLGEHLRGVGLDGMHAPVAVIRWLRDEGLLMGSIEEQLRDHPHAQKIDAYLRNGISPEALRYAATHESLCRHWIFDLLTALADIMEEAP